MNHFRFTVAGQVASERRINDRRELLEEKGSQNPLVLARKLRVWLPLGLIVLSIIAWQWRYIIYAPVWFARAHWASHSDLYTGKSNGISNRRLVLQARDYLADINNLDASGNVTAPEALRPQGAHLDISWFKQHVPDSVEFNPFISPGGSFVVTWFYFPGCQKSIWKSSRTDTDWYSLRGRPCYPVCRISILMSPDLRLTSIEMKTPGPV